MKTILITLGYTLNYASYILGAAIFGRCLLSWIPAAFNSRFGILLRRITDPLCRPAAKLLSKIRLFNSLPIDFSPWLTIIFIEIISYVLATFCFVASRYV